MGTKKSTIRARVKGGRLQPLRKLDLPEGSEVTLTLVEGPSKRDVQAALSVAGAWRGKVDARRLVRDIYASRLVRTRPEPRL